MAAPASRQQSQIAAALTSCRSAFIAVGVISLVINLLMPTGPMFMLQIYDRVLTSRSLPTLMALAGLAGGLYLFFALLEGLRSRALIRIGQRFDARLAGATFAASIAPPVAIGDRFAKLEPIGDLEQIRQFLSSPGPTAIFDLPWLPIYLCIVFLLHPILGWVGLAGGVIIGILVILNELTGRGPMRDAAILAASRNREAGTARRNAEVIAAMGMRQALQRRWLLQNDTFLASQGRAADRTGFFTTTIKALRFVLQSAVLGVGAWLVIRQEITPGVMIAASIITSRALAPVELAVSHWRGFLGSRQAMRRLADVLAAVVPNEPNTQLPLPKREISVTDLATGPIGSKIVLVQGATFTLRARDGLGIIGPSGAGKTSLVRGLLGIWPLSRGAVRFDGAERDQWEDARSGQFIGYLPQTAELFDGTIAENIARFAADHSSDTVLEAARLADIHDMVTSLPKGYDTTIGEAGLSLSAGQRQRIGLARAIYGSPFLVVLDEPNSNLDAEGEDALTRAILEMRQAGSVVIVIAHRPSAIKAVDYLLYLKDGRTQLFGPKQDVLKQITLDAPQDNVLHVKNVVGR